jgi:hypothetical protein
MNIHRFVRVGALAMLIVCWCCPDAPCAPVSGVYEIVGGTYSECCGFAGTPIVRTLPFPSQSYIRFTLDSPSTATLTILGDDLQTVAAAFSCLPTGPVPFDFHRGQVQGDITVFPLEPNPLYTSSYIVTHTPTRLTANGALVTSLGFCADVPHYFDHTNVVANLIRGPKLTVVEPAADGATRIMVQGRSGWTDIIEASSDLASWRPVSTNYMDFSLCPICPFGVFEDRESTNLTSRFYRAYEIK